MDPIEYLKAVRRRWKVVALTILAALATGLLTSWFAPPPALGPQTHQWSATTTLLQTGSSNLATMAALTTIGEVPERVAKKLRYEGDPMVLALQVTASADSETGLLSITGTSSNRGEAVELSGTFAGELVAFLTEQNALTLIQEQEALRQQIHLLRQEAAELEQRIADAPRNEVAALRAQQEAKTRQADLLSESFESLAIGAPLSAGLRVVQEPTARAVVTTPDAPVSLPIRLAIAGAIGFLAGVAVALVLDRIDTRIRTRRAAEEHFGLPVLSEIPVFPRGSEDEVIAVAEPQSPAADAFRLLGAAMTQPSESPNGAAGEGDGHSARTIMVTSSGPGEGKSTVVANLAATLAEVGHRVLVLSCDFRRPSVHRMLGVSGSRGLADAQVIDGGRVLERRIYQTSVPGVRLVPSMSKPKRATEMFASGDLARAVEEARESADIVILDTAPLLVSGEVPLLIPEADAVIVVARARRTKAELAARTGEILKRFDAPVRGVVLMAAEMTLPQGYHRYQRDE